MEIWLDLREGDDPTGLAAHCDRVVRGELADGIVVAVHDDQGQQRARSVIGSVDWVLAELDEWKMIPLENLVAAADGTTTSIAAMVAEPQQVQGAAHALQIGVDAILIPADTKMFEAAIIAKAQRLETDAQEPPPVSTEPTVLSTVKVIEVSNAGLGDRVCIDLTCLLDAGEGMMVGSSSSSMVLVHGETIVGEFVPTRPFRVNAGPVHAYTVRADGSTAYLSELEAGDEIRLFSSAQSIRSATIGRLKIERRPMILLKWVDENDNEAQGVFQQAETVRLVAADTQPISVTEISVGQILISKMDHGARHIGRRVNANVEER